jgi:hypothetical protein
MIPAGYMAKRVEERPDWLGAVSVADIYSLSGCVSEYFCDYVPHWKHNGFWLFDSPEEINEIAAATSLEMTEQNLFYYEVYEKQFDDRKNAWEPYAPDPSFKTDVKVPDQKTLEGFDVVTFYARSSPECSPLSCNSLAAEIPVNAHCLLPSLEEAIRLVEMGQFDNSEPGPFRIFAVYSLHAT